jgi:hypothetical protein
MGLFRGRELRRQVAELEAERATIQTDLARAESEAQRARFSSEIAQAEAESALAKHITESVRLADLDEDRWVPLGGKGSGEFSAHENELGTSDYRKNMLARMYVMSRRNPHVRAVLGTFRKYLFGRPLQFIALDRNPKTQRFWDEFSKRERFHLRLREMCDRFFRDGEVFLREFKAGGLTQWRFIEPQDVEAPEKLQDEPTHSDGVIVNPSDVEDVRAYWIRRESGGKKTYERVPAEKIIHLKFAESNEKRGHSYFEALVDTIQSYGRWINNRLILHRAASQFLWWRQVRNLSPSNTPASKSSDISTDTYGRHKHEPLTSGSMLTTNDRTNLQTLSPNLRAEDAHEDGKAILYQLAAGSGLADFVTSGDISKANFSSAMASEGPMMLEIEAWQEYFGVFLREIYRRVIQNGIDAGLLAKGSRAKNEDGGRGTFKATATECDIVWPDVAARDVKKEAEANSMLLVNGVMSRRTMATKAGLDFDREAMYLEEEGGPPEPPQPQQGQGGEEDDDSLASAVLADIRNIRRTLRESADVVEYEDADSDD